jgi:hypothetical protein
MRAIFFAIAMLPAAAMAQDTTLPTPAEPVAAQSCPVGMTFNTNTQSCGIAPTATPMPAASGNSGCAFSAAREVTS